MKSKRRHELQHNALDVELGKMMGFLRAHATKLAVGALIIAVLALGWTLYRRHARASYMDVQALYEKQRNAPLDPETSMDDVINGWKSLSQQDEIPWIAADALVRLGNWNLARMTLTDDATQREALAQQAKGFYQQILSGHSDQIAAVGAAHVGLARVAEGQRDYATAREQYEKVTNNTLFKGFPIADSAAKSLRQLAGMQQPVQLASALPQWAQPPAADPVDEVPADAPADAESDTDATDSPDSN